MAPGALDSLGKVELIALIRAQAEQIRLLTAQNAALNVRIGELEARLEVPPKTPTNSSLPPSKGEKANRPAGRKKPRKGRPGAARELCANPDHVIDVYAKTCKRCGAAARSNDQPHVQAYDHIDLPPLKAVVTRVHHHSGDCRCCGAPLVAEPPEGMAPGSPFGPGIVALVVLLHTKHMVSYSRLVGLLQELIGLSISEGAIANMLARAAKPFAKAAEEIAEEVRKARVVASDETSARVMGKTHWQWVFGCASAVYHTIADSRGAAVATTFLKGARPKVWISDRLAAQMGHAELNQVCLSHLLRDAQFAIDAGDRVFAPGFKSLLKRACAIGRRRDRLKDATLIAYARDLDNRLARLLSLTPTTKEGLKLKRGVAKARDKLFVFLTRRDVPATNNASERHLRPSVIFRRVTNGFRSAWGAKVYADIASIAATGQLQGRSALEAIRTALAGGSLLAPACAGG